MILSHIRSWLVGINLLFVALSLTADEAVITPKKIETAGPITIAEVGNTLISSYGGFVIDDPKDTTKIWDKIWLREKLSPQEMRQRLFNLFVSLDQQGIQLTPFDQRRVNAIRNIIDDIELLLAHDKKHRDQHLFSKIDRTTTLMGQIMLAKMVAEPSFDPQTIKARQNLIRELLHNQELFDQLQECVAAIKKVEHEFCTYLADDETKLDPNASQIVRSIRALFDYLRGKSAAQEVGNWMTGALFTVELGGLSYQLYRVYHAKDPLTVKVIAGGFYGGIACWMGKALIDLKMRTKRQQERLIKVGTLVRKANRLKRLLKNNPLVANGIIQADTKSADLLFEKNQSDTLKDLLGLLETSTFQGEASHLSFSGRIDATAHRMALHKNEFAPLMAFVGKIDAYLAIVRLIKERAQHNVRYCFVDFVQSPTPYLQLQNFWNPQIDPSRVVTNDIELGAPKGMRNMVLTGSNTGGKSTLIKGLLINILLAQTFGIACAERATMTMFDYVVSTMNSIDNTMQDESLYQAEVNRIADIINGARICKANDKKCFIVMDEPLRGTSGEQADSTTHYCASLLSDISNVIFTLVTHHINKPLKLEHETGGICKNYKIEITKEGNKLIKTYKLKPGINESHIAQDILNQALNALGVTEV